MNSTENDTTDSFNTWCANFFEEKGITFFERPLAKYTAMSIGCFVTVAAFVNNVVVFLALTSEKSRPSTATVSLTLTSALVYADLLLSVTTMPAFAVLTFVMDLSVFGRTGCMLLNILDIVLCTVSILHLMLLAFDRYLAICHPFTHHRLGTRSARMASVTLWILSGLVALPMFIPQWQKTYITGQDLAWHCLWQYSHSDDGVCFFLASPMLKSLCIILSFYLPLFIIIVLHVQIYFAAREHAARALKRREECFQRNAVRSSYANEQRCCGRNPRDPHVILLCVSSLSGRRTDDSLSGDVFRREETGIRRESEENTSLSALASQADVQNPGQERNKENSKRKQKHSDDKAIRTVLCLVLCFVVCWLPLFVSLMVDSFAGHRVPFYVLSSFTMLGYLNSAMNPVLYYCFNVPVRGAIRRFLGLKPDSNNVHSSRPDSSN